MTQKEIKEILDKIEKIEELKEKVEIFINEGISEKVLSKYINKIKKYELNKERITKIKSFELEKLNEYDYVLGIDEVGRGPLAGPVVTCCTMMKKESFIMKVDDSKKLSEETREELFEEIKKEALFCEVGMSSNEEIDDINILNATFKAMNEAYLKVKEKIEDGKKILVLIDGNLKNPLIKADQITVIKGDSKCYSIACASIIAKVTRDRIMDAYDKVYPEYDFVNNKGYGTEKHRKALKEIGPIEELHRKTFITNLI